MQEIYIVRAREAQGLGQELELGKKARVRARAMEKTKFRTNS